MWLKDTTVEEMAMITMATPRATGNPSPEEVTMGECCERGYVGIMLPKLTGTELSKNILGKVV